jgi:hypothetical protein
LKIDIKLRKVTETPVTKSDENVEQTITNSEDDVPKKMKLRTKIKLTFQAIKPIITSHHPLCEQFKDHTFHLFGRDWCIGCYIGYPSGILMLLIGNLTGLFSALSTNTLWIIGGCLMATYILSIVGLTKIRWIKIVSKIPLGFGVAFLIAAIFSYPIQFWISFLLSFFLIQIFISIISIKRAFEMKKTCTACEFESDRNNCPGMHPVMEKLNKIKNKRK